MRNRKHILEVVARAVACVLVLIFVSGCATSPPPAPAKPTVEMPPPFPPLSAMQSGDYATFLSDNESVLRTCQEPEQCAAALFNLGFLYSYPKSPYYNPPRALKYLDDLGKGSPESVWAYQARVWSELLKKNMQAASKKRPARGESKSKEAVVPNDAGKQAESQQAEMQRAEENKQADAQQESNLEAERQRALEVIRSKDETIKELNRQIERSRQIDIEIDKKERGLLY